MTVATPYLEVYESRQQDPIIDRMNRASVANGKMNRWQRFNKGELIYLDDADGTPRALTPRQYQVLVMALEMADTELRITMREMAQRLAVAPSTVSRALTKLNAWGLLASIVVRGRYASLVIIRRVNGDGLDSFRREAKARIRRWYQASQARISRLRVNVATYIQGDVEGTSTVLGHSSSTTTRYKDATLKWTPEELRDAGII